MQRFKRTITIAVLVVIAIIGVLGVYVYRQLNKDTIKLGNTNGELSFISDRDGSWDIFMLYPDGTLVNLTAESTEHEYFHNFTFDGKKINFYSSKGTDLKPGLVNTDGSDFKTMSLAEAMTSVIKDGRNDNDPRWGPGGEELVWFKLRGLGVNLFIANSDGSSERELVDKGINDISPAWSPDGSKLVWLADKSDQQNVWVLDMESGDATQLTEDYWDFEPAWSRDGEKILFVRNTDDSLVGGDLSLYIMNADGSDLHAMGEDEEFEGDETYSPYGGQVTYMSNEDGNWHIYVMDADGSNVKRLTEGDSNNLFPAWRPVPASEQTEQEE